MSTCTLIIGNRNYSSWSLRGWLAASQSGIDFETELVRLSEPGSQAALLGHSPAGRVPVLRHGERVVWDSLAIIEYLAELCPQAGLWPADADARAMARSIAAEMHAGFAALRAAHADEPAQSPARQGARARRRLGHRADRRDLARGAGPVRRRRAVPVRALLRRRMRCTRRSPRAFAPTASRSIRPCQAYADAVLAWPAFLAWQKEALEEPWIIPEDEV